MFAWGVPALTSSGSSDNVVFVHQGTEEREMCMFVGEGRGLGASVCLCRVAEMATEWKATHTVR